MPLKEKIENGRFVVLLELEPPKGVDVTGLLAAASGLAPLVDAFVASEMSGAVMRMSAWGAALALQQKGMEAVMQVNCRDRNRLALQADLLAAYACGIRNLMVARGEEPAVGDHHEAKAVYDVEIDGLLSAIQALEQGADMAGKKLQGSPSFYVGSTVMAGGTGQAEVMKERKARGVRYFVTQPIFDLAALRPLLSSTGVDRRRLLIKVLLLKSAGMARYLALHGGEVQIAQSLVERLQAARDVAGECAAIAAELVSAAKAEELGGVLINCLGWEARLPEILGRRKE